MDDYDYYLSILALDMTIMDLKADGKSLEEISEILAENFESNQTDIYLKMLKELETIKLIDQWLYDFETQSQIPVDKWAVHRFIWYNSYMITQNEMRALKTINMDNVLMDILANPTVYWDLVDIVSDIQWWKESSDEKENVLMQIRSQWIQIKAHNLAREKFYTWFHSPIHDMNQLLGNEDKTSKISSVDYTHWVHQFSTHHIINDVTEDLTVSFSWSGDLKIKNADPLNFLEPRYSPKTLLYVNKKNPTEVKMLIQQKLCLRKLCNYLLSPTDTIDTVDWLTKEQQSIVQIVDKTIWSLSIQQLKILNKELFFTKSFENFLSYSDLSQEDNNDSNWGKSKEENLKRFFKQWLLDIWLHADLPKSINISRILQSIELFVDTLNPLDQAEFELDREKMQAIDSTVVFERSSDGYVVMKRNISN